MPTDKCQRCGDWLRDCVCEWDEPSACTRCGDWECGVCGECDEPECSCDCDAD